MKKELNFFILAGANGVGKTTVSKEFLKDYKGYYFLNSDEIAKSMNPDEINKVKITAGKTSLSKLDELIANKENIVFESTLASRSFLKKRIETAHKNGYKVVIIYTFVDKPEICIERIKGRVKKGGHFVPDEDVIRRFHRSINNFWRVYKNLADAWFLYYNMSKPVQIARGTKDIIEISVESELIYNNFFRMVKNDERS